MADEAIRLRNGDDILSFWPVGSIYMSVNPVSPATFFGGTWERITGRFLLAATDNGNSGASQAAGNTGGAATHTLTEAQLPSITGKFYAGNGNTGASGGGYGAFRNIAGMGKFSLSGVKQYGRPQTFAAWGASESAYDTVNMSFGSGQAHNNMPPYLSVYMWQRTA